MATAKKTTRYRVRLKHDVTLGKRKLRARDEHIIGAELFEQIRADVAEYKAVK